MRRHTAILPLAALATALVAPAASAQQKAAEPVQVTIGSLLARGFQVSAVEFVTAADADAYYVSESTAPEHRALEVVSLQSRATTAVCVYYASTWINQSSAVGKPACSVYQ